MQSLIEAFKKVYKVTPAKYKNHLLSYFTKADFDEVETSVKKSIALFKQDAEEICKIKSISYPDTIAQQVISYFNKRMDSLDWE